MPNSPGGLVLGAISLPFMAQGCRSCVHVDLRIRWAWAHGLGQVLDRRFRIAKVNIIPFGVTNKKLKPLLHTCACIVIKSRSGTVKADSATPTCWSTASNAVRICGGSLHASTRR